MKSIGEFNLNSLILIVLFLALSLSVGCGGGDQVEYDKTNFAGLRFRNNGTDGYMFGFTMGQLEKAKFWNITDGTWYFMKEGSTYYNPYDWHDLVISVNGTTFNGYVDGNLEVAFEGIGFENLIGAGAATEFVNAKFDEFKAYNFSSENFENATDFFADGKNKTLDMILNTSSMSVGYHELDLHASDISPVPQLSGVTSGGVYLLNASNLTQDFWQVICYDNGTYEIVNSGWEYTIIESNDTDSFPPPPPPAGRNGCLLAGTMITLSDSRQVPIEKIRIGEAVLGYDFETNSLVNSTVMGLKTAIREGYYIIALSDGSNLSITDDHPIYIDNRDYQGWASLVPENTLSYHDMSTKRLEIGDYLSSSDKDNVLDLLDTVHLSNKTKTKVESITYINQTVKTYNLAIKEDNHNYYANSFLVHNERCESVEVEDYIYKRITVNYKTTCTLNQNVHQHMAYWPSWSYLCTGKAHFPEPTFFRFADYQGCPSGASQMDCSPKELSFSAISETEGGLSLFTYPPCTVGCDVSCTAPEPFVDFWTEGYITAVPDYVSTALQEFHIHTEYSLNQHNGNNYCDWSSLEYVGPPLAVIPYPHSELVCFPDGVGVPGTGGSPGGGTPGAGSGAGQGGNDDIADVDGEGPSCTCPDLIVEVLPDYPPYFGNVTSYTHTLECTNGNTCNLSFPGGDCATTVGLEGNPYLDSVFAGWGGDCSGTGNCTVAIPCLEEITSPKFVSGFFINSSSSENVTITLIKDGAGGGTVISDPAGINCPPNCAGDADAFVQDTYVNLTATPDDNSSFVNWAGSCSGSLADCELFMDTSHTVYANFSVDEFHKTLTLFKAGSGSGTVTSVPSGISCDETCSADSANYLNDQIVTLTAAPYGTSYFSNWQGACSGSSLTCNVLMTSDKTVYANFSQNCSAQLINVPKDCDFRYVSTGTRYTETCNDFIIYDCYQPAYWDPKISGCSYDLCPPTAETTYNVTGIREDKSSYAPGEKFDICVGLIGEYLVISDNTQTQKFENCNCYQDCTDSCYESTVLSCKKRCAFKNETGSCDTWETDCEALNTVNDCYNDCLDQCDENNNSYYHQCNILIDNNIYIKESVGGEVVKTQKIDGQGYLCTSIPLPLQAGEYDVYLGTDFLKSLIVTSAPSALSLTLNETNFFMLEGESITMGINLSNIDLGGNYNISIERWQDPAHTVSLPVPSFIEYPVSVSVSSNSSVIFDMNITDAYVEDSIKEWNSIIVRAVKDDDSAAAFTLFTLVVQDGCDYQIVNYTGLIDSEVAIEKSPAQSAVSPANNHYHTQRDFNFLKYSGIIAKVWGALNLGDMDLYNVTMDSTPLRYKVVINFDNTNITEANILSPHKLYLDKPDFAHDGVYVCPNAKVLNDVFRNCEGMITFNDCETTAGSPKDYNGNDIWVSLIDDSTYEISGLHASGAGIIGITANLNIWDENDSDVPYGNQRIYFNEDADFYANYTNSTLDTISSGTCIITFNDTDSPQVMTFNSADGFYNYTRQFVSGDVLEYNVTCNSSEYEYLIDFDTVTIDQGLRPSAPELVSPENEANITDVNPTYDWNESIDPESDMITYQLQITNDSSFTDILFEEESINETEFYQVTELATDVVYYWRVRANDSVGYGDYSDVFNFTLESYISIIFINDKVNFSGMLPGETNSTSDDDPRPFVIENKGNQFLNITVLSTPLFLVADFPSSYYRFSIDENETNSYNLLDSLSTYINITNYTADIHIYDLNWSDLTDTAEIELFMETPQGEPSGVRQSTITVETQ